MHIERIIKNQYYQGVLPADIYLLKIDNGNITKICETCSNSTIKTTEQRQCY